MAAQKSDIERWFDIGLTIGARWLIVVCDTFDHDDYPIYIAEDEDFYKEYDEYDGVNMQRIMEVYDLKMDRDTQFKEGRAHHEPPRK